MEKFFDNVSQDRLMSYVHILINDGDTESLIRKYLKAGVMTPEGYERTEMGTPQGGNLSPLLSNIMLNDEIIDCVADLGEKDLLLELNRYIICCNKK